MLELVSAILQGALGNLAADVAKSVLEATRSHPTVAVNPFGEFELDLEPDSPDDAESLRFLTRQRAIHRIDLARAKWNWLILTAYHHPKRGRTDKLPDDWDPRVIGSQLTVSDFAGHDLPHEGDIGENAPSNVRVSLLHTRILVVAHLRDSIEALDGAIRAQSTTLHLPEAPWQVPGIQSAWAAFLVEAGGRNFADLPNLNSYCGFKNLWAVSDTPAAGIRLRTENRGKANLFAYGANAELASLVTRSHYRQLYKEALANGRATPHQWAHRKVAVRVLKDLWNTYSDRWLEYQIPRA